MGIRGSLQNQLQNQCLQEWLPFNDLFTIKHNYVSINKIEEEQKSMTFWIEVCGLAASLQSSCQSWFSGWFSVCSGSVCHSGFQIFSWIKGCCRAWLMLMRLAGSSIRVPSSRSFSCITFFLWSSGSRWPPIMSASRSLVGLMVLITVTFSWWGREMTRDAKLGWINNDYKYRTCSVRSKMWTTNKITIYTCYWKLYMLIFIRWKCIAEVRMNILPFLSLCLLQCTGSSNSDRSAGLWTSLYGSSGERKPRYCISHNFLNTAWKSNTSHFI